MLSKIEAEVAAKWWVETLRGEPDMDTLGHKSPEGVREKGNIGAMFAEVLGNQLARECKPTEEQLERFRKALVAALTTNERLTYLGCDYGPDAHLQSLASMCGISPSRFPWKTHMHMAPGYVAVSCGYGAPEKVLHQTREHLVASLTGRISRCKETIAENEGYLRGEFSAWAKEDYRKSLAANAPEQIARYKGYLAEAETQLRAM